MVTSNDPRDFARLPGYFDVIVVDAPCSGSGLWRKDARAFDEWSTANVQLCSERQQRILADVWSSLKQDGILIYATCSYSPQEDEHILDWLAAEYQVQSVSVNINDKWGIVPVSSTKGMTGYRFFPDKLKGEGFFIAALQKKEGADEARYLKFKSMHDKKIQQQAGHLLADTSGIFIQTGKETYNVIRPGHEADCNYLTRQFISERSG